MYALTLFDTAIGRCGIAWGGRGVLGVQLPEKTNTATRTRLLRHCPSADPSKTPPRAIERAIEWQRCKSSWLRLNKATTSISA